jgi:hypothetical protein
MSLTTVPGCSHTLAALEPGDLATDGDDITHYLVSGHEGEWGPHMAFLDVEV